MIHALFPPDGEPSALFLVFAGLALLALGGELLVRGAVGVARALGVSPLLVGLTIVGFGTSTPELVTSIYAALEESPGIAVGNVVGSNIANILLILGLSALIVPLNARPDAFLRDGFALAASTIACFVAVRFGTLDRLVGISLVVILIAYFAITYWNERRFARAAALSGANVGAGSKADHTRIGLALAFTVIGIGGTIWGAALLVDGAIDLARRWGVSEAVIGLSIVAVGTSLPELVASLIAALRRHADVALGNVIGSNIYNVFGILGLTAIVHPIPVPSEIAQFDIWVLLISTVALIVFLRTQWSIKRWEATVFLAAYASYVAYLAALP